MLRYGYVMLVLQCSIIFEINAETIIEDQNYWQKLGNDDLERALNREQNTELAKNVILFIGDGMGPNTITAARIYGKTERGYHSFEKFPNVGLLKTYSADKYVPDSSCTATALFTGVKSNYKTTGVDATVEIDDCEASLKTSARLKSLADWAQEAHKSTGFVTTTRVTHATPSALYAHSSNRNWECEATMPKSARKCKDIARQLIEDDPGRKIQVIMGGGRQCLVSNVTGSPADPIDEWSCYRQDGRNLMEEWKQNKKDLGQSYEVILNNRDLANLSPNTDHVLGIFANGHLKFNYQRDKGPRGMPSLTNMTEKALQVLRKNKNGFFLMVEGGLIDFAHHRGHAKQALDETTEFDNAIRRTLELTRDIESETLIIVTSDHAHALLFTGHAQRTANILDIAEKSKINNVAYTSLLYGTGGPNNFQFSVTNDGVERRDPESDETRDFEYSQQALILTDEAKHSGVDVYVYAKGPMAHLFHSLHEQTYVTNVISYAAKIGYFKNSTTKSLSNLFLVFITIYTSIIVL